MQVQEVKHSQNVLQFPPIEAMSPVEPPPRYERIIRGETAMSRQKRAIDSIAWAIKKHGLDGMQAKIGSITPHPYQSEIGASVLRRLAGNYDLGVMIYLMTGGGKTEIALAKTQWLRRYCPDLSIAFVSNRDELVGQTCRRAFACGLNAYRYQSKYLGIDSAQARHFKGKPSLSGADIIVASSDSYKNQIELGCAPIADVTFFDEAHYEYYKSYVDIIDDHGLRVGLSATPLEARLRNWWQSRLVSGISQYDMECPPYKMLAAPQFMQPAMSDDEKTTIEKEKANRGVKEISSKYDKEASQSLHMQVCGRLARDLLAIEDRIASDLRGEGKMHCVSYSERRWMVRAPNQIYASRYADILNAKGIKAKAFTSDSDKDKRRQLEEINAIFAGQHPEGIRVAVIVQKFVVGYDHPGIEGIILTNNMERDIFFQACGRVLRSGGGLKSTGWIIDLAGNVDDYIRRYADIRFDPPEEIDPPRRKKKQEAIDKAGSGKAKINIVEKGDLKVVELLTPAQMAERSRLAKEARERKRNAEAIAEKVKADRDAAEQAKINAVKQEAQAKIDALEKQAAIDRVEAQRIKAQVAKEKADRDAAIARSKARQQAPAIERNPTPHGIPIGLQPAVITNITEGRTGGGFGYYDFTICFNSPNVMKTIVIREWPQGKSAAQRRLFEIKAQQLAHACGIIGPSKSLDQFCGKQILADLHYWKGKDNITKPGIRRFLRYAQGAK